MLVDIGQIRGIEAFYSSAEGSGAGIVFVRPVVEIPLDSLTLDTWSNSGDTAADAYNLISNDTSTSQEYSPAPLESAQVEFSAVTWDNGTASITLTSTDSSLYIQYQKNGTDETSWTTGTNTATVTGLTSGDTIYVRLYNGTDSGGYASFNVVDYIGPTVTITETTHSTSTIEIAVTATDAQSGMPATPTYTYYYKKTGTSGWTTAGSDTTGTCTFEGLEDGTDYDIKVSTVDIAGATGSSTVVLTTDTMVDVEIAEEDLIGKYVAYIPDSGTYSLVTNNSTYTGSTANDTDFATDTTLNWQIWSIDGDMLTLIADGVQGNGGDGSGNLTLYGAVGYNNGVYILNDICKTLYSNSSIGAVGRSFTREDIEAVMNWSYWAPTSYYYSSSYDSYAYISTKQYTSSSYRRYPYIWQYEDFANIDGETVNTASYTYDRTTGTLTYSGSGWRSNYQDDYYPNTSYTYKTAGEYIEPTETYWYRIFTSSSSWTNSKYASLYKCDHTQWLATRCVSLYSTYASFFVACVDTYEGINGASLSNSKGDAANFYRCVRPVVEIPLDSVTLDTWSNSGDTADDAYNLISNDTPTSQEYSPAALESAQVEFSAVTWDSGLASITLTSTDSSLYIQYQKNGTDESSWTTGTNTATVTDLSSGDVIYVRLYDGTNTGGYASFNIIDYIGPSVTIETTKILASQVTVSVTATDAQSGMGSSPEYTYMIRVSDTTSTYTTVATTIETTYTFTGLDAETDYDIKVSVADSVGAVGSGRISVTTDDLIGYYVAYEPESGVYDVITGNSTYTGTTANDTDFATDTDLNWQIWSIDDDTLTLIADDTSQNGGYDNTSNESYGWCLYLSNYTGYNNGVELLNQICEALYSNSSIGATGRSFCREDIEAVMDWSYWAPTSYYYSTSYDSYTFISTKQYISSTNTYYPYIWRFEDFANIDGETVNTASYTYESSTGTLTYSGSGWKSNYQDQLYPNTDYTYKQASNYIEPTETYWYKGLTSSSYWTNSKYASLYKCVHNTWLASRCVYLYSEHADFSLAFVDSSGGVTGVCLTHSSNGYYAYYRGIRPVIEIPLDTNTLNIYDNSGEDENNAFTLE